MIRKLQTTVVCSFPNTTVLVSNTNWNLLYKTSEDNQVQVLPCHRSLSYNLVSFISETLKALCGFTLAGFKLNCHNVGWDFFKIIFIVINSPF